MKDNDLEDIMGNISEEEEIYAEKTLDLLTTLQRSNVEIPLLVWLKVYLAKIITSNLETGVPPLVFKQLLKSVEDIYYDLYYNRQRATTTIESHPNL